MLKCAVKLDFSAVSSKLEQIAADSHHCWGCGAAKEPGEILCGTCLNGCDQFREHQIRPYKDFVGTFDEWLRFEARGIRRALC